MRAVRQWYHGDGASGTLAVVSRKNSLDVIPRERAPASMGLPNLSIVRVLPDCVAAVLFAFPTLLVVLMLSGSQDTVSH
jgi:hypothetical protein